MGEIFEKTWDPQLLLKCKISKIELRYVLSWSKLGLGTHFNEAGTFGGFGTRAQSIRYSADF